VSGNFKGWRSAAPTLHSDRMGSKEPNFHLLRTLLHSWKEMRRKVLLTNYCSKNGAVPSGRTVRNGQHAWQMNWLMEQWKQTQPGCMLAFNHGVTSSRRWYSQNHVVNSPSRQTFSWLNPAQWYRFWGKYFKSIINIKQYVHLSFIKLLIISTPFNS